MTRGAGRGEPRPGAIRGPTARAILLLALALAFHALWWHPAGWPLKLLVVLLHEGGHALATLATGGRVVELGIDPGQGGHTLSQGGSRFLVLNGGYLGSLLAGAALLSASRTGPGARRVSAFLGAAILVAAGIWVPLISFAFVFCVVAGGALLGMALRLPAAAAAWALRAVGVFSVLYAFTDIRDDVFGAPPGAVTDATMLAASTGIPAPFWGLAWLGAGAAVLWRMRRSLV